MNAAAGGDSVGDVDIGDFNDGISNGGAGEHLHFDSTFLLPPIPVV